VEEPTFFNPYAETHHTRHRLPHWQQEGAVIFVTFRLGDSIPAHLLSQLDFQRRKWLKLHPPPWSPETEREYHNRFSAAVERWLDAGYGSCVLRDPRAANIVAESLQHFDGERHHHIAWVIMPNHVHALFIPGPGWELEKLLHSWKSFSSHQLNGIDIRMSWMRDYFDRMVRNEEHFYRCIRYIRRNPAMARLRSGEYVLWESELAQGIE
jgi:REP element-mobilizing transposase RayT